jgi:serine/threonine-protein kinase RsbT
MNDSIEFSVTAVADIEQVRRDARVMARAQGLDLAAAESVTLAVSELATNLLRHASGGQLTLVPLNGSSRAGVEVRSRDSGPGIADSELALQDGFSSTGGLGSGLPGVRRLMDEFELTTGPGGTSITARKWARRR